jgi:hypothetical protein
MTAIIFVSIYYYFPITIGGANRVYPHAEDIPQYLNVNTFFAGLETPALPVLQAIRPLQALPALPVLPVPQALPFPELPVFPELPALPVLPAVPAFQALQALLALPSAELGLEEPPADCNQST